MKAGMEFAVSTLVVLILGLFIVGGGVLLVWQLFGEADTLAGDLTATQRAELGRMLTSGQLVAVYPGTIEAKPDTDVVAGLALENQREETTFTIVVEVFTEAQELVPWRTAHAESITLAQRERAELPIVVRTGTDAGTYTVIVSALHEDGVYDSKRFFTIRVR